MPWLAATSACLLAFSRPEHLKQALPAQPRVALACSAAQRPHILGPSGAFTDSTCSAGSISGWLTVRLQVQGQLRVGRLERVLLELEASEQQAQQAAQQEQRRQQVGSRRGAGGACMSL
jgi:hypothetical protein